VRAASVRSTRERCDSVSSSNIFLVPSIPNSVIECYTLEHKFHCEDDLDEDLLLTAG
jgi:hypothetical protein